jgi:hypothetical protein
MKKHFLCFVFAGIIAVSGCSINQDFVETCDSTWQVIGPEYAEYVQKDKTLDERTKKIRLRTAEIFTKLIEKAKEK